jgi:heme-degrading monooxygenase HmoA
MVVQIVRFRSALSDEEVLKLYGARAPRYRSVAGLVQKYYLRYPETGEHGAVYVWESQAALAAFRESDLARSIGDAYRVQGEKRVEPAEVVMVLR